MITREQGDFLLRTARKALRQKIEHAEEPEPEKVDPALEVACGTFVTLKIRNQLRGCIGNLGPVGSIYEGVKRNAVHAALHDYRFQPVTPEEIGEIDIEISILTPPQPLEYTDWNELLQKLRPGVDGIIIEQGQSSATFLPQVWEQLPQPAQFLSHLCAKAGLAPSAWKDGRLAVQTYQVQSFAEGRTS